MAAPWSQFGALWVQDGPSRDPLGAPSQRQSPPKAPHWARMLSRRSPRSPRMAPRTSFWTVLAHLGSHSEGLLVRFGGFLAGLVGGTSSPRHRKSSPPWDLKLIFNARSGPPSLASEWPRRVSRSAYNDHCNCRLQGPRGLIAEARQASGYGV